MDTRALLGLSLMTMHPVLPGLPRCRTCARAIPHGFVYCAWCVVQQARLPKEETDGTPERVEGVPRPPVDHSR